jgi:hypothetical protein
MQNTDKTEREREILTQKQEWLFAKVRDESIKRLSQSCKFPKFPTRDLAILYTTDSRSQRERKRLREYELT